LLDPIPEFFSTIENLIPGNDKIEPTILVDFDGTIYSYESGWVGVTSLPDGPNEGAKEAIEEMRRLGYRAVVCSARACAPGGSGAIQEWLDKHEIEVDGVTHVKEPHMAIIDDRGVEFNGDWPAALKKALTTKPWYLANLPDGH